MAASQPFGFVCKGGLDTNTNQLAALGAPGTAIELQNFEVDSDSGYRRINGYIPYGTAKPNGTNDIKGVMAYAGGLLVCSGSAIMFTIDGITWVNVARAGQPNTDYTYAEYFVTNGGKTLVDRTGQGQTSFVYEEGIGDNGTVVILDGDNPPFTLTIKGTGALDTRTYHGHEFSIDLVAGVEIIPSVGTRHETRLVVGAGTSLYYSSVNSVTSFSTGAHLVLGDTIVGLKSFRDDVIIFCANSIHKFVNMGAGPNNGEAIVPITTNVGCLAAGSIQEIGGDLVFLSSDGIRTVAGTARIGDVELSSISRQVQPTFAKLAKNINNLIVSSAVIRSKNQYRLFYSEADELVSASKGIIGTLTNNGFEWSETLGIQAHALDSSFDTDGVEKYYHGDKNGYIYLHDQGKSFYNEGVAFNINSKYVTPFYDFGDVGSRKTLHYVKVSISPESTVIPTLHVRYDYNSVEAPQPTPYVMTTIPVPSVYGLSTYGGSAYGGIGDPMVRQAVQGSGHTANFSIISDDQKGSYRINGLFIDYVPAGRR